MDTKLFLLLNNLTSHSVWFDRLIYFCAEILPWVVVIVLVVFILAKKSWPEFFKMLLVFFSAGTVWFLTGFFKYLYLSPRPFVLLNNIKPLFVNGGLESMPSGHAIFMASLAGASVLFKDRRIAVVLSVGAIIIAVARVVAGVHWPSDVVVGLTIGFVFGLLAQRLWQKIFFRQ